MTVACWSHYVYTVPCRIWAGRHRRKANLVRFYDWPPNSGEAGGEVQVRLRDLPFFEGLFDAAAVARLDVEGATCRIILVQMGHIDDRRAAVRFRVQGDPGTVPAALRRFYKERNL